jgi:hypothetical protein
MGQVIPSHPRQHPNKPLSQAQSLNIRVRPNTRLRLTGRVDTEMALLKDETSGAALPRVNNAVAAA